MLMFKVTRSWLHAHSSGKGGWTRVQLASIGIGWPPPSGWVANIVGNEVTEEQRAEFERLSNREALAKKKADDAVRHAAMEHEVYYTWPVPGGWEGSDKKPAWWDK